MITVIITNTEVKHRVAFNETNQAAIAAHRGIINNTHSLCVERNQRAVDCYSANTALRYQAVADTIEEHV